MFSCFKRRRNDEEEPAPPPAPKGPPFPIQQMFVLSLVRITEPVAFSSIFPYVYYMVLSFGITDDRNKISTYCGLITSIFTLCEFSTGIFWGRMSDIVGRKPVLIMGLFGTGVSMLIFGFAKTLPMALLARGIGGALNGNVGVIQTAVAEVVTHKEQQPFAFSIMPFVWSIGAIAGSALGGALADPVTNYPGRFSPDSIWGRFPFLLPNIIAAVVTVLGMVNGILFLNETNEKLKNKRDYGREVGHWLTRTVRGIFGYGFESHRGKSQSFLAPNERSPLLRDGNGAPDTAAGKQLTGPNDSAIDDDDEAGDAAPPVVEKIFVSQVVVQIVQYGIIAYHTIIFEQLLPVILSTPEADASTYKNIIIFKGGYGLQTSTIGVILALQGAFQMIFQIFFFAPIIYKFGSLRTYVFCALTFPLLYIFMPYTVLLPAGWPRYTGLAAILVFKVAWNSLAYPANALLLTNAAPSLLVLGTINGVAASTASFFRCLGPVFGGIINSVGEDYNCVGLSWWVAGFVAILGYIQCFWMEDVEAQPPKPAQTAAQEEAEAWERESMIFRRGSVAINVSNPGEPSIVESQIWAGLTHRGSTVQSIRRMSMASHRRPSISGSILSQQTTNTARQPIIGRRDRSVSNLSHTSRQVATPSRGRRDTNQSAAAGQR